MYAQKIIIKSLSFVIFLFQDVLFRFPDSITALAVHPLAPNYLVVGRGNGTVQLLDRRKAGETWRDATAVATLNPMMLGVSCGLVKYRPSSLKDKKLKIPCVNFNSDGSQLLASYSEDYVYLFNSGLFGSLSDITRTPRHVHSPDYLSQCDVYPGMKWNRTGVRAKPTFTSSNKEEPKLTENGINATTSPLTGTRERTPPVKRLRLRGDWSDTGPEARPEDREGRDSLMDRMSQIFARWIDMSLDSVDANSGDESREREEEEEGEDMAQEGELEAANSPLHVALSDSDLEREGEAMERERKEPCLHFSPLSSSLSSREGLSSTASSPECTSEGLPYSMSSPASGHSSPDTFAHLAQTQLLPSLHFSHSHAPPSTSPQLESSRETDPKPEQTPSGQTSATRHSHNARTLSPKGKKNHQNEGNDITATAHPCSSDMSTSLESHTTASPTPQPPSLARSHSRDSNLSDSQTTSLHTPSELLAAEVKERPASSPPVAGGNEPRAEAVATATASHGSGRPHGHKYRRSWFKVQRGHESNAGGQKSSESEKIGRKEGRKREERGSGGGVTDEMEDDLDRQAMDEALRSVRTHLQPFMVYKGHRSSRTMVSGRPLVFVFHQTHENSRYVHVCTYTHVHH